MSPRNRIADVDPSTSPYRRGSCRGSDTIGTVRWTGSSRVVPARPARTFYAGRRRSPIRAVPPITKTAIHQGVSVPVAGNVADSASGVVGVVSNSLFPPAAMYENALRSRLDVAVMEFPEIAERVAEPQREQDQLLELFVVRLREKFSNTGLMITSKSFLLLLSRLGRVLLVEQSRCRSRGNRNEPPRSRGNPHADVPAIRQFTPEFRLTRRGYSLRTPQIAGQARMVSPPPARRPTRRPPW